ncbi:serine/arginine repetitive matrix protein 1 [Nematostella vectensis]|uniref:serine/arginine repetitive matrix protein 1 n=1 Tax=Nematostella vectensis TaxID=45351 RepID=UPI00207791B8|nr:serine/arginine repetitive matrix protein 1 [Nematostella vectensis]
MRLLVQRGKQLLTLESGRKSLTGEGVFQFYTSHGDEIYELIRARSKALFANAVSKRNHFKPERSCSYEDLPSSDSPSVRLPRVNTMNEARLLSKRNQLRMQKMLAFDGRKRSGSDSCLSTSAQSSSHMSPASVKRDLLNDETSSAKLLASTADSVFVEHRRNLSAVLELDKSKDEPLENTYLDLVVDDDTEPIHISGPRRISMASSTSESEKTPEHDNQGTERPAYVDERRRVTTAIPKEQSDGNKPDYAVREDKLEYSNQTYTDPGVLREITPKDKPLSDAQKKLTDDFFAQLANPTAHQQTVFPSKPRSMTTPSPSTSPPKANRQPLKKKLSARKSNDRGGVEKTRSKSEKVAPPKVHEAKVRTVKSESEAGRKNYAPEAGQQQTEMNKKIEVRPEEMEGILEKVLSQMETPLRQTTGKLVFTKPKRNSTGSLCTQSSEEKTNVDPCDKGDSLNVDYASKRQVEKSKSHSGIERASTQLNPPPLPVRPPLGGTPRTRGSASMGDIFEGINLRPDLGGMDRQKTFFAKGINMHHTSTPTGKNWPPLACGPESHHATRLLMRSNTAMQLPSEVIGSPPGSPQLDDPQRSRSSSLNRDEEERNFDEDDAKKRRGSKASKIIGRIFNSMSFSPRDERRGSNECGTTELEDLPKSRKASLTPGIVNEGWSPDNSADTSPSEGSPRLTVNLRASRRASHDGIPRYNPGSPPVNHNMREEQMRKAHARERERAELPDAHEPPPALPPRKHSDPPPLPPRRKKSHEDSPSPCTTPRRKSTELSRCSPHFCRPSAGFTPLSTGLSFVFDENIPPPPVPPRRDERRGSQAPAIHLTKSSPDAGDMNNESDYVGCDGSLSKSTTRPRSASDGSTTAAPPTMSCAPNTNVPSPIPQRPPKSKELCTRQQHVDHGLVDDAAKLGRREVVGSNSGDKSSIEHEKAVGKHGKLLRQAELVEPSAFSSFERTSGHCRLDMARDEYTTALGISFPTGADYQNNNTSRQGGVGQRSTDSTRVSTLRSRSVSPHSSSLIPDGDPVARKYSAGNIEAASENFGKGSEMLGAGRNNAGRSSPVPLKMPSRGGGLVMSDSSPTSAISV